MKNERVVRFLRIYFTFFLIVAFLTSCLLMLYTTVLAGELGVELTRENISGAAKITFVNVILLSFLMTVLDYVRRRYLVDRPVRHITEMAQKMAEGDFDARIPQLVPIATDPAFCQIIDCFNTLAEELSGVETLREDFVASVSHEMKTPLAVIRNYATLLKSKELDERERLEYAEMIGASCDRLSSMMSNILRLSRLENQQIYPKSTRHDLGEHLCEALLAFEEVWERGGIELSAEIAQDVVVVADGELLSLVWNNLISNALKFTDRGGRVSVRLYKEDGYAVVEISDTGCGMTPEVGAHIFEKFYQGDTSHKTEGNGLGLALVKRVIDILGAEISVESKLGVGSTFKVKLEALDDGKM